MWRNKSENKNPMAIQEFEVKRGTAFFFFFFFFFFVVVFCVQYILSLISTKYISTKKKKNFGEKSWWFSEQDWIMTENNNNKKKNKKKTAIHSRNILSYIFYNTFRVLYIILRKIVLYDSRVCLVLSEFDRKKLTGIFTKKRLYTCHMLHKIKSMYLKKVPGQLMASWFTYQLH